MRLIPALVLALAAALPASAQVPGQLPGMTVVGRHAGLHVTAVHAFLGDIADGEQVLTFMTASLPESPRVLFEGYLAHPLPPALAQRYRTLTDARAVAMTCREITVIRIQRPSGGAQHFSAKGSACTLD
jgi:hypothetical protein